MSAAPSLPPPIRPALPAHIPQITAIYNHYVSHSVMTFHTSPQPTDDIASTYRHVLAEGTPIPRRALPGR